MRTLRYIFLMLMVASIGMGFTLKSNHYPKNETTFVYPKKLKRILILGNSITIHGPKSEIGWFGKWGMAASAEKNDFVHILMDRLLKANKNTRIDIKNIADYERDYWNYNLSQLDSLVDLKPDLIVLRISENVDATKVEEQNFKLHYLKFVDYLKAKSPKTKIMHAASFWDRPAVTKVMADVSLTSGGVFLNLSHLSKDPENMALNQFKNKGVAMHPSDKGMLGIADAIWAEMVRLFPALNE